MNRLKNFKVGSYLYSWRAQGYVQIISVGHYIGANKENHDMAVVSGKPFSDREYTIDVYGRLIEPNIGGSNAEYVKSSPTFFFFDDLDTYYQFVKHTTNTPVVVKKMKLSGIEPGDIIIVRTPVSVKKNEYTVDTVAEDHNYISVREGTLAFNMNGGCIYRKYSCYISAYRKKGSDKEIQVNLYV